MQANRMGAMKTERTSDRAYKGKEVPTIAAKTAVEAAAKAVRAARSDRMAAALSSANRKTGLFKK